MLSLFRDIKKQYKGTCESWGLYWGIYGGWKSIIRSTYFWGAFFLTIICYPIWLTGSKDWAWFNVCNSILPNVLGFTLGGYAILLAFGSSRFMELIAGSDPDSDDEPASPFMMFNATFLHFIVVQVLSIVLSIISLAWDLRTGCFAFAGFLCFIYALAIAIAAALAILNMASSYDLFIANEKTIESQRNGQNTS